MSRILLTGATGFLGSHIAGALVEAGHAVRCTVRRTSDTRWIDDLGVETLELDLATPSPSDSSIDEALGALDAVIHCGGLTRAKNESSFMEVNATGTAHLARAAAGAGVPRFVLISSLAARGPDGSGGPISPYGRSKLGGEQALATEAGSMETVILRPGGIYGPRDADLLPLFKMASRGWIVVPSSEVPLQPVYVEDVVSATLASLTADPSETPLPVVGSDRHDWVHMARALGDAVGRAGRLVRLPAAAFWTAGLLSEIGARFTGDAPAMDRRRARDLSHHSWTSDIESTVRALAWRPEVDIASGLDRTARWYREVGWL